MRRKRDRMAIARVSPQTCRRGSPHDRCRRVCCRMGSVDISPSSASSAKGRNGTAELLAIIANENNDRIPTAARLSLDILARQ